MPRRRTAATPCAIGKPCAGCKRFLAGQAIEHPNISLKEQEIAEEVFADASDFDPRAHSRVRVPIKRLRGKLSKYHEDSGAGRPSKGRNPRWRSAGATAGAVSRRSQ